MTHEKWGALWRLLSEFTGSQVLPSVMLPVSRVWRRAIVELVDPVDIDNSHRNSVGRVWDAGSIRSPASHESREMVPQGGVFHAVLKQFKLLLLIYEYLLENVSSLRRPRSGQPCRAPEQKFPTRLTARHTTKNSAACHSPSP